MKENNNKLFPPIKDALKIKTKDDTPITTYRRLQAPNSVKNIENKSVDSNIKNKNIGRSLLTKLFKYDDNTSNCIICFYLS